jgi:hypothetical protein
VPLGVLLLALPLLAGQKVEVKRHLPPPPAVPVAPVRVVEGTVERGKGDSWKAAGSEFRLAPGESVRTAGDGLAWILLPWMRILIGSDSIVGLTPSTVLSAALEKGRVEQRATRADILKVVTPEAEVRGRGSVVVRRDDAALLTRVSSLDGRFSVKTRSGTVVVDPGQGLLVAASGEPQLGALPAAPGGLRPGKDPSYVEKGKPARLTWTSAGVGRRYHVQVLTLSGDDVLLTREVEVAFLDVPTRWPGTYQWRVSSIDERGVEGKSSASGLFCVVDQ